MQSMQPRIKYLRVLYCLMRNTETRLVDFFQSTFKQQLGIKTLKLQGFNTSKTARTRSVANNLRVSQNLFNNLSTRNHPSEHKECKRVKGRHCGGSSLIAKRQERIWSSNKWTSIRKLAENGLYGGRVSCYLWAGLQSKCGRGFRFFVGKALASTWGGFQTQWAWLQPPCWRDSVTFWTRLQSLWEHSSSLCVSRPSVSKRMGFQSQRAKPLLPCGRSLILVLLPLAARVDVVLDVGLGAAGSTARLDVWQVGREVELIVRIGLGLLRHILQTSVTK